jgi:hypothetical protein
LRLRAPQLITLTALFLSLAMAFAIPCVIHQSDWPARPPEVPFLLTPSATGTHVRSSVFYFIAVLATATIAVMPIELAKLVSGGGRRTRPLSYTMLFAHQLITFADVIRVNAWDWWFYLLSLVHLQRIDAWTWLQSHPSLVGRWPWPTTISAILLTSVFVAMNRRIDERSPSEIRP